MIKNLLQSVAIKALTSVGFQYNPNPTFKHTFRNQFSGADTGRLYASFTTTNQTLDAELKQSLRVLRARSRDMERNNDYAKKFLRMMKSNVIGPNGIIPQSQVVNAKNNPDQGARKKIETAWKEWTKKGVCDVTGKFSFRDIQKLVIGTTARDGEILIRRYINFDNEFKYALQLIEPDHLDDRMNETYKNGNQIKMGVEYNKFNRPVAYHIYRIHPGDYLFGASYGDKIRIPADEILHIYNPIRISQTRGVPWMHSALTRLNMLGDYETAELVAARLGAAKGGFYQSKTGDSDELPATSYENGQPIQSVEPGHYELLAEGLEFKAFDPTHPTTAFADFNKSILRGIASGLDVSYNGLANDLEGVNYSSIRAGVLDERDVYKDIQKFIIQHFLELVYDEFLFFGISSGSIQLPLENFKKYKPVKWQTRGWQWVDPLKDVRAKEIAIANGFETPQDITAETGKDFEENLKAISEANKLKKMYKINGDEKK